ncbi:MAG TPA: PASTA domain-containing protein [Bacteroidales bacterium]|nr:PASTA domain-containing protein [Bacteroidales bacterium]
MKLLDFIKSRDFLKHLVIAVVVAIVLFSSTFMILNIYTQHGDSFPLPDFKKLSREEASELAADYDVEVEVTDSVYQDDWPKGTVVKQNPTAGFHVKQERTIFLTMNAQNPEMVKMPNVVGLSHRAAKATLNNSGLKIGKLIHVPDIAVNNVLKQKISGEEIDPGETIPKGTQVDLVLGKGLSNRRADLPELIGDTLARAKNVILQNAMNLGAVKYDTTVHNGEDSSRAFVWQQYPPYKDNKEIRLGTYIDLWLTLDSAKLPEPDTTQRITPDEADSL